jgi:hypothetical protein
MTTNAHPPENTPGSGMAVLLGAAAWGFVAAIAAVIVGFVVGGSEAGIGALVGGLATIVVLAVGTGIVLRVATVAPVAAMLTALVVFTAQGLLLLLTLAVLAKVTDGDQVTAAAVAVIAVTVAWTTSFAVLVRRERIPLFDLSGIAPPTGPAPAPPDGPSAG